MQRPFIYRFEHVVNRCGHASIALVRHNVQSGMGWVVGLKTFYGGCIYIGHTRALVFVLFVHLRCLGPLETLWFISSLDSLLSTYKNLYLAIASYFASLGVVIVWYLERVLIV